MKQKSLWKIVEIVSEKGIYPVTRGSRRLNYDRSGKETYSRETHRRQSVTGFVEVQKTTRNIGVPGFISVIT